MKTYGKLIVGASVLSTSLMLSGFFNPVLADEFPKGIVTGDDVNLRENPGLESKVITQVDINNIIMVLGKTDGWYQIRLSDGTEGWMSASYVSLREEDISRSGGLRDIVDFAKRFLGVKYVYGGSSPKGFDCSGFTSYIYKNFGIELPRTAFEQSETGEAVDKSNLEVGDLVFFKTLGSKKINHAGIYIGEGNFIHSSSGGGEVRIDTLLTGYYNEHYAAARRVK
ncbi:MAG: C40 family peptidase [Thermoanaerobacteraceae bacterium]|nr:C40 family peptidase [Thermoanaerobacteraceae bacterium]